MAWIQVKVSDEEGKRLKHEAVDRGVSLSELVREKIGSKPVKSSIVDVVKVGEPNVVKVIRSVPEPKQYEWRIAMQCARCMRPTKCAKVGGQWICQECLK